MDFFKRNKKTVIIAGSLLFVLIIGTGALSLQTYSDKIAKNMIVAGVDIGDLNKKAALKKLTNVAKFKNITLEYDKKKWLLAKDDLDLQINFEKVVDEAYNYNKEDNFFSNLLKTLKADFGEKTNMKLSINYNQAALREKIEEIKTSIDRPIKDATLEEVDGKVKLIPDEPGLDLNLAASFKKAVGNLKNNEFNTELNVKKMQAKITANDLKGMDALLGSYETTFGGMQNRDFNIKKSTIDSGGIILKPGQEYSFNGLTGEKTLENGYKGAPIIESGKLVIGIGGGVCQTSSTIFNTALLSGMEITTRRNHTIPSDYVSLGRDATVVDGNPGQDFKFKNPFKHPVFVKNYVDGNKIGSQIYGFKDDKQNIKITTEMISSFGGGMKTIVDPSLPAGKRVVEKPARVGYKVLTYRLYLNDDGSVIKSEQVASSSYPSQVGLVRVGGNTTASKNSKKAGNLQASSPTKPLNQTENTAN